MSFQLKRRTPRIGDVYCVAFEGIGSEMIGPHPAVILQNNVGNLYSPNVIVAPMTSKLKKVSLPTHVVIPKADTGLKADSMVLCENIKSVSKQRLGNYLTSLSEAQMAEVAEASLLATSAISFLSMERIRKTWERASEFNANTN